MVADSNRNLIILLILSLSYIALKINYFFKVKLYGKETHWLNEGCIFVYNKYLYFFVFTGSGILKHNDVVIE